jgi:hypothetical protein
MSRPSAFQTVTGVFFLFWAASAGALSPPPPLMVSATYPQESTGTMHYAESLTISLGSLKPLVFESGEDFGVAIPGPWYRLDKDSFVLLGWSSGGSGMQSLHAMLIEVRDKALAVGEELELLTDRPSAGVVVRPAGPGSLQIGVVEPREFLHDEEVWSYSAGNRSLDADGIRKLSYEEYQAWEDDKVYAPPFGKLPKGRIAWITVTSDGFDLRAE